MLQAEAVYLGGQHTWLPQSGVGELIPLSSCSSRCSITGRALPERGG